MYTVRHISGDTWKRAWIIGGQDSPVDITGASARLQLRDDRTGELLASADSAVSGLTITGVSGRIDLRIEASVMALADKTDRVCKFDLELTMADGTVRTIEQAKLKVIPDITRD